MNNSTKRDGRTTEGPSLYVLPWRLVSARPPECCCWEHLDGRWVSITLCDGNDVGKLAVADSAGRRQLVDSYEGALDLAKSWRT